MNKMKRNENFSNFFSSKKVLLTGHTGFMGGWLGFWLTSLGANVHGVSLAPHTTPSFYELIGPKNIVSSETICDIRDRDKLLQTIKQAEPEIIYHLAAQALVNPAREEPAETFSTNVQGTVELLDAARQCPSVKAIIVVTSDKVYENVEWDWGYRENDRLGGYEPYGVSKACAELVIDAYRHSYFKPKDIAIASVRAGNIIGGGDWADQRLIPDAMRAFSKGDVLHIRRPSAVRPWQHVLEPLHGYLLLTLKLYEDAKKHSTAWNFGPKAADHKPVSWIAEECVKNWGDQASWQSGEEPKNYEANYLSVTSDKAKHHLGWYPVWDLTETMKHTVNWYKSLNDGKNMLAVTKANLETFTTQLGNQI